MNATSLYVSTSRLVFQADPEDTGSWSDLYRLIPYLRQSLSCTVCGNLLIEPYTPTETNCQHHVCRSCKGGKKKLKPSCSWCKDYEKYVENVQLRILLQCYKKLCEYVANSCIYRRLIISNTSVAIGGSNLIDLINEGSGFKDEFKSSSEQKSAYSVSGVYTSTSTQTSALPSAVASPSSDYILQNKIKDDELALTQDLQIVQDALRTQSVKRRSRHVNLKKSVQSPMLPSGSGGTPVSIQKTGCRCGNATATPGKLTCCGQRCPCYIDSKACLDCKCRGCRNPHTSDGHKVVGMYTTQLHSISASPPGVILDGISVVTPDSNDIKLDI